MTAPDRRPGYSAQLGILLSTVVGINVGYTAVLPFLPEFSARLGFSSADLAIFFVGFAVAKIAAQPFGGWLADTWSPRGSGTLGLVLAVAGMVMVTQADTASPAIFGRLLWGVADGIVSPAVYGAVTAVSEKYGRDPARGYAKLGVAAVLSFAGGPFIVGLVHSFADYEAVLTATAALTLLNAVVAWFVFPRRAQGAAAGDAGDTAAAPPERFGPMLRIVAVFGGIDLCANLLWGAMEPLVPLYLKRAYEDPTGWSAWVLTAGMVVFAAASPLLARLPVQWRAPHRAALGLVALGVSCVGLSAVAVLPVGFLAMTLFMVAQAYIYLIAREGIRRYCGGTGRAWGAFGVFSDAGFVIGPMAAVFLFEGSGTAAFTVLGIGSLLAAGVVAASMWAWRPRLLSEHAGAR
jgi:MFS family permease